MPFIKTFYWSVYKCLLYLSGRNCRYAIIPQPVSASVVRNFTTLGYGAEELKRARAKIVDEEFFKNFPSVELPELESIDEISEPLRQHMYAEWLKKDQGRFRELKAKFNGLYSEDQNVKSVVELDPSRLDSVKNAVGELVDDVQFNNSHVMHLIVPNKLRLALFDGWKDQNYAFVRLLAHYGEIFYFLTNFLNLNIFFNFEFKITVIFKN
jgi:hypothetical protein